MKTSQKISTAHGLLVLVLVLGVVLFLTRATWQESLASYMPVLNSYAVVTPSGETAPGVVKTAVIPNSETEAVIKNFFSTEKKYVYLCGWTAQAGTFYPNGTVYETGTLEYNPNEETRANAGYGTWSLEGSVLKGYFGPYGEEKITLRSFQFESGYVLSDTEQPHQECTYLFADSNDTLNRYTTSLKGFEWGSLDSVLKMTPNKNSKPAPMSTTQQESVVKRICRLHSGPGYIIRENSNNSGVVGGFVVQNFELTGGSTYYYGAEGTLVAEVVPLPSYADSKEGKDARAWYSKLTSSFPLEKKYNCSELL